MKCSFVKVLWMGAFLLSGCSREKSYEDLCLEQSSVLIKEPHLIMFPIAKYTDARLPCITIEIEGHPLDVILDLGSNGSLSLTEEVAEKIIEKTFVCQGMERGIRGGEYPYQVYDIPEVVIEGHTLIGLDLQVSGKEIQQDALLASFIEEESSPAVGSLGWAAFSKLNIFLDITHDQIALCDSLKTLEQVGYRKEDFTAIPITLDGSICFDAFLDGQLHTCMLDTGATWSLIHKELPEGKSIQDQISDLSIRQVYAVGINGYETEHVSFAPIPIGLSTKIDAILGMNFIHRHVIFIDFDNQMMYLSRAAK